MLDNQELYIHLEGLTPYENMLYKYYVQKAQEAEEAEDMANYLKAVERLKSKTAPKDLTSYLTA